MNDQIELTHELSQNFLDFSYEANCQRAFADARDGLKPGQRACLWEMYNKGYNSSKPHVKSAKISGGVISSWWPHGDTAIYDTFARMSQSWINNIPEVDWHGANGSVQISADPAAARYTEARLSKQAEEGLLFNIKKHNVNMKPNFSEDDEWPEVFPALIPRLMINGCQGIGSTIANVWLPTALDDLYPVIKEYVENNNLNYNNLHPSFPSGGIIINKNDIPTIYATGKGKVILRAKAEVNKNSILITEIPYQVYVEPLIEEIKKLVEDNTVDGIANIINKSDRNKLLIEIECDTDPYAILNKLYRNSNLQKTYSANQYALVGKTPKLLNLKDYLDIYINHNYSCIIKENEYELTKAKDRLEIVNGLIKALEDIDNIIAIIKKSLSAKDAANNLINVFNFTQRQANAIVDMKLGRLANLEKIELNQEQSDLVETIKNCTNIIANQSRQKEIFIDRLGNFVKKYSNPSKTEITQIEITKEPKEIVNVEPEKVVVVMTKSGLIKRVPAAAYKVQKRNGKGIKSQNDIIEATIRTNTVDNLIIFTDKGKVYKLLVDKIPQGTNTTNGIGIKSLIEMDANENPTIIYSIYRDTDAKYIVMVTKNGIIKKVPLEEFNNIRKKSGLSIIKLKEKDELAAVFLAKEEDVVLITKNGMVIRYTLNEVSPSGRIAIGLKGIGLNDGDVVVAALPIRDETDYLAIFSNNGFGKKIPANTIVIQKRGGKGQNLCKTTGFGDVTCASLISDEDSILLMGSKNSICISGKDIPVGSKTSTCHPIIKNGNISSASKV